MDDFFNSGPTLALFDAVFRHVEGYDGLPDVAAVRKFVLGAEVPATAYARNFGGTVKEIRKRSGSTRRSSVRSTTRKRPRPSSTRRWRRCWTRRPTSKSSTWSQSSHRTSTNSSVQGPRSAVAVTVVQARYTTCRPPGARVVPRPISCSTRTSKPVSSLHSRAAACARSPRSRPCRPGTPTVGHRHAGAGQHPDWTGHCRQCHQRPRLQPRGSGSRAASTWSDMFRMLPDSHSLRDRLLTSAPTGKGEYFGMTVDAGAGLVTHGGGA